MNRLETLTVPVDLGVWLQYWELGQSGVYFSTIGSLYSYWETVAGSPTGDFISQNKKELIEVILGSRGYRVSRVNNLRKMTMSDVVPVDELQDLLVPKQEELESKIKVLIEAYKQEDGAYSNPENGWISGFVEDLENLVEEEPLYHALIKGYELLNIDGIYWTYDKNDHDVFFSVLSSPDDNFSTEMSKAEWNKLGINESNAHFVEVTE